MSQTADRVYRNAKVYSIALDGTETHAQAVAIRDGKFVYVGDEAGVKEWIGESTEVIDCNGKSVIPGLGDAHMHLAHAAKKFATCSFSSIVPDPKKDTPEGVIKRIQDILRAYVEEQKDAKVIRGLGWDRTWFSGGLQGIVRPFTRHDIDVVVPDKPAVLMSYCGHRVLLNTKALEAAGVNKDTDDHNGLIVKEADGSPSGYIKEPVTFLPIIDSIPNYDFSPEEHRASLKQCFDMFNSTGFTLMCDCQQGASYPVLTEMAKNGEFTTRVSGVHNVNDATRQEDMERALANRTKFDVGDLFTVNTVKYFADGQFSMIEPYADTSVNHTPGTREPLLWDEAHMEESMALANKEGFNIHTHAMGSYAIHKVIDCYENAQKLYPDPNIRNIIAHCTFIDPPDRVRMGRSHIIASNQPAWFNDNPTEEPIMVADWGEDVVRNTYPSKSLIDNGVVCAYGSDFFVSPSYGITGIQVAMTRRHVRRDPTYELFKDVPAALPEECVSLKEALQAHTIHPAYQAHLEDITGSIEVGKSAELVVLDSDIESVPVEGIQDIQVLETVFKGKTVFRKQ
ncbi:amidohydrolase [Oribacterium sp. FC2011]|uniref:amidohydrolase n=1 Tax=Oribacterium sp. FC2011 TaxID=1408311 RepID=UPI0004E1742F|nr:amidohydrolase [Oribacterium sp. FC2011]